MSVITFSFGSVDCIKVEEINEEIVWEREIISNEKNWKDLEPVRNEIKRQRGKNKNALTFYKYLRSD